MLKIPESVTQFLQGKRFAVAGVSRQGNQPANAVFRKLRSSGYEVYPVNPKAGEVEGVKCFPNVAAIPTRVDGLFVATHPRVAADLVRQCDECGIGMVWFHRSSGQGSVSDAALQECKARGIKGIVGGCPLMYCPPVDGAHKCMRYLLRFRKRIPG